MFLTLSKFSSTICLCLNPLRTSSAFATLPKKYINVNYESCSTTNHKYITLYTLSSNIKTHPCQLWRNFRSTFFTLASENRRIN